MVLLAALGGTVLAEEYRLGDLVVQDPWARERCPPVSATGGGVVPGRESRRARTASCPCARPSPSGRSLHTHELEDGIAKMRHLPSVEVPAHGDLVLEPVRPFIVMLIGPERSARRGARAFR